MIGITAYSTIIWHKASHHEWEHACLVLRASDALKAYLFEAGKKEHFSAADTLFHENADNTGVFLVLKGKVCLGAKGMPTLDRIFGRRSMLGLPSSFTGRPYSLTATAMTEADVVHVAQQDFLRLMRKRPDLCREATEMLGREITFIQSALAKRRQTAWARTSTGGFGGVLVRGALG